MKIIKWNPEKNKWLKENRGVGFEDVVMKIASRNLLDIVEHHNKQKYPDQKIFIVEINNYAYLVPFIEDEKEIFLKTIIPCRKATKKYLTRENKNDS